MYGEDIAILAGDALLSTSFEWVAKQTPRDLVDAERILDVIGRLGKSVGAKGLAGGQAMDLICEGKGKNVTIDDLRWIHTHKTAALLDVAVASGAILGGATPEEVKACETFALNIGLAFQVADDILDVTQSTEELGKTAAKDLEADKTTYPKLLGLREPEPKQSVLLPLQKKPWHHLGIVQLLCWHLQTTSLTERTKNINCFFVLTHLHNFTGSWNYHTECYLGHSLVPPVVTQRLFNSMERIFYDRKTKR